MSQKTCLIESNQKKITKESSPFILGMTLSKGLFLFMGASLTITACAPMQIPPLKPVVIPSLSKNTSSTTLSPEESQQLSTLMNAWMTQLQTLVKEASLSPPVASRLYAYAGVAMNESLSLFDPDTKSLVGKINGLTAFHSIKTSDYQVQWVMQQTLESLVLELVPTFSAEQLNNIQNLTNMIPKDLSTRQINNSKHLGKEFAQHLYSWASQDGFDLIQKKFYTSPSRTGNLAFWEPTEPNTKPVQPYWGELRPFAISQANACHHTPQIAFSTANESAFFKQAQEVYQTSRNLSAEQKNIANWWADNPGKTGTPPGHWLAIATQLAKEQNLFAPKVAKLYAVLGMALADAFISCWHTKYQVNLLRPKTYIRQYLGHNNWNPLLNTPPFPEYPSGHSVGSGAAAEILTQLMGKQAFTDQTHMNTGQYPRQFADFKVAAQEAAISRLYGGIHFREAIEQGLEQGQCIAETIWNEIK